MELLNKKYSIIYADPPWKTRYFKEYNNGKFSLNLPYNTMTDEEIINMSIDSISLPDSVLFMWCIDSKLQILPEVFKNWGFDLKCIAFIWYKKAKTTDGSNSPFPNFTRRSCEYCFLGTRGKIKPISRKVEQFHSIIKNKHSKKPDIFRNEIVKLYGNIPRIELFAREYISGWDAFGDELYESKEIRQENIKRKGLFEW